MRKSMSRLLSIILSAALLTGMIPAGAAFAAEEDSSKDSSVIKELQRQMTDTKKDAFAFRPGKAKTLAAEKTYPAKFDLSAKFIKDGDETPYVTPVKFQNPFGSCWGFAAIATAETSILGDGIAPGYAAVADSENKVLDLSEKHVINFLVKPLDDPANPQNGEGMYYTDNIKDLNSKFNLGGASIYATNLFASGMGPDREDRDVPDGLPANIFEYKGLNELIMQNKNKSDGKWVDYCYSDDDDWSMPEELRFKQSYTLAESYILPDPAKDVSEEGAETPVYEYDPDATRAIKDQLTNKRAVEIAFLADQSTPDQENEGNYISKNWAHYTNTMEAPNHAVTIVGWDDDYPRANFIEGKQPPEDMFPDGKREGATGGGNGAWLVKNSWGSEEEAFPNKGPGNWGIVSEETGKHTGYFWISYYDQTLGSPEALRFSNEVPKDGYYLDQHDYMPVSDVQTAELDDKVSMANVFKAEVNEQLESISCQTSVPGTKVKYEIYLLADGYESPIDGAKVASGESEVYEYGGFHKIDLAEENKVAIQKNQSYSIVITMITSDNQYSLNLLMGTNEASESMFETGAWQKGVINPGESFVYMDGKWSDYSDAETQKSIFGGGELFFSLDNFPIKGYCKELQNLNIQIIGDNPMTLPPYEVQFMDATKVEKELVVRFKKGKGAVMPEDTEITWAYAEGSDKPFDFEVKKDDTSRCTLTAVKPGTGFLEVTASGIGKTLIRVTVPKTGWYDVWDVGPLEYGESTPLWINNYDGSEIPEGSLTYKSDDKKIIKVTSDGIAKAVGVGKTVIRVSDEKGVEEVIKVKVTKATQQMTVKAKTVKVKASQIRSKDKTYKRSKALKIKKSKGKLKFKKVSGNKKIKINSKTGRLRIKKGLKKGTYKIKVKVTAKGNKYYKKKTVTKKIKVKVK